MVSSSKLTLCYKSLWEKYDKVDCTCVMGQESFKRKGCRNFFFKELMGRGARRK